METRREKILELLFINNYSLESLVNALDLSVRPKVLEEDIFALQKSGKHKGYRILVQPAQCINCGFSFKASSLFPSRCPKCRAERVAPARIRAEKKDLKKKKKNT